MAQHVLGRAGCARSKAAVGFGRDAAEPRGSRRGAHSTELFPVVDSEPGFLPARRVGTEPQAADFGCRLMDLRLQMS